MYQKFRSTSSNPKQPNTSVLSSNPVVSPSPDPAPTEIDISEPSDLSDDEEPCCPPCGSRSRIQKVSPEKKQQKREQTSTSNQKKESKKGVADDSDKEQIMKEKEGTNCDDVTQSQRLLCSASAKCPCFAAGVLCRSCCRAAKMGRCRNLKPSLPQVRPYFIIQTQ